MLEAKNARLKAGSRWIVDGVNWRGGAGELWAVLGPNGAGKSSLLRLLAGECAPTEGEVLLNGKAAHRQHPQDLALQRAVLLQTSPPPFPFQAQEVVMLGRLPHSPRGLETAGDVAACEHAMHRTATLTMREQVYPTLSGGERQRVDLARVLAQDTPVVLLDEPVSHLDPLHQYQTLTLARRLAEEGRLVVAVLHDLNLAALFAHQVLLMNKGAVTAAGEPGEVITADIVEEVYGLRCEVLFSSGGHPILAPAPPRLTKQTIS